MSGLLKIQSPPLLNQEITYSNWKIELEIWKEFVDLPDEKKGPAVFLSLVGQARDAVRQEVAVEKLKDKSGLDNLIKCLDKLYLKDETCSAYEAYEEFDKFIKPHDMKINEYIIKFEQLYGKAKSHRMEIHDGVLAYRLLNGAGLSESNKQLVRATVSEMKYDAMKEQLKKVFINTGSAVDTMPERNIKVEPSDALYASYSGNDALGSYDVQHRLDDDKVPDGEFCGYTNYRRNYRRHQRGGNQYRGRGHKRRRYVSFDIKGDGSNERQSDKSNCCYSCGSLAHWARDCPKRFDKEESL